MLAFQPQQQQEDDPFSLTKRFDQMRGSMLGGLAPYQPPQVGQIAYGGFKPGQPFTPTAARGSGGFGDKTAQLQAKFPGLRHTSGYRDPQRNASTPGASPTSYHMEQDEFGNARANDWVGSAKEMQEAAALAKAMGATEVLVHNAGTGMHLHVAW